MAQRGNSNHPSTSTNRDSGKRKDRSTMPSRPTKRWKKLELEACKERLAVVQLSKLPLHAALSQVEIRFGCGGQVSLSATAALGLNKLKCSLEHAMDGRMSGGVSFEENRKGKGAGEQGPLRAVVKEPTCIEFSIELIQYVLGATRGEFGAWDHAPGLGKILRIKAAAAYWGLEDGASAMLRALIVEHVSEYSVGGGYAWGDCPGVDQELIGYVGLSLAACVRGLHESECSSKDNKSPPSEAVLELLKAGPVVQSRLPFNKAWHSCRSSGVQSVLSALDNCMLEALMPPASAEFTDITDASAIAAAFRDGGAHAQGVAHSVRVVVATLKDYIDDDDSTDIE